MEKSTRERILDAGLELLGTNGFRSWSLRGAEDLAGVPHGSARHHFNDQQGLVLGMVRHLLDLDMPHPGELPSQQIRRWLGPEATHTRARYELIVASFHDPDLASELVRGRDRFVVALTDSGLPEAESRTLVAALDGCVLDAILRSRDPVEASADIAAVLSRFSVPTET